MMNVKTIKGTTFAITCVILVLHLFIVINNDKATFSAFLVDLSFILVEVTLFNIYFYPHLVYKWKAKLMKQIRRVL